MPPAAPTQATAPPAPFGGPPPGRRRPSGEGSWGQPRRAPRPPAVPWTPCRGSTPPEYPPAPPSTARYHPTVGCHTRRTGASHLGTGRRGAIAPSGRARAPLSRVDAPRSAPSCSCLSAAASRAPPRALADPPEAAAGGSTLGDGGVGDLVVEAVDRLKKGRGGGAGPKKSCADAVGSRKVSATTVVTAGIPRSGSMSAPVP